MAENQDFTDTPYDYSADEMDVEVDSDQEQDLDKMLHSWLGELESVTQSLDSDLIQVKTEVPQAPAPRKDNLDLFQLSYSNLEATGQFLCTSSRLEETQDIDLDALLGDLCEMEQSLQMDMDKQMNESPGNTNTDNLMMSSLHFDTPPMPPHSINTGSITDIGTDIPTPPPPPPPENSDGFIEDLPPPPSDMLPEELQPANVPHHTPVEIITEPASPRLFEVPSPPTQEVTNNTRLNGSVPPNHLNLNLDVSNSQQSLSSISTSPNFSPPPANISKSVRVKLKDLELDLHNDETLSEEEKVARIKAEKVRIALEKLKAARVKKLIIKVHTEDGSSKTVFVDETMNTRNIVQMMIEKNHFESGPNWALIEQMPDLYMERVLEDDENVVTDVLLTWSRETNNRILFSERREKYALFKNPQHYLLSLNTSQFATEFAEKSKKTLIDEFFVGSGNRVPELEGPLFLKSEGKKSWKKHYFVLRASGLYYSPKGKSKVSKDLMCLVQFEHIEVYNGVGWKKKYKAPTDFCFALKHPQIQQKSKYIKYICAEDYRTCQRWITGVRIAKYGKGLLKNFEESQRDALKFIKNQDTASEASLGDTSSLSSDQSVATVSSQGSASSGGSGIQSRNANRRSHMGDIFSQAWKKGKEVEVETKRLSRSSMSMSIEVRNILTLSCFKNFFDDTGTSRPPLVTPTMTKSDKTFDYDVQQQLQQLEREMELDLNLEDLPPSSNVSGSQANNTHAVSNIQPGKNKTSAPAAPRRMDSTRLSTYSNRSSSFSDSRSSNETKRVQFKEATEEITTPPAVRAALQKSASGVVLPNSPNRHITANSQRSSMKISRSSTNQSPLHRRPSLPLANTVYTPPWLQQSVAGEASSISTNTSYHAVAHTNNVSQQIPVAVPKPTVSTPIQTNKLNQANIYDSNIVHAESPSVSVQHAPPPTQSTPPLPPKKEKAVISQQKPVVHSRHQLPPPPQKSHIPTSPVVPRSHLPPPSRIISYQPNHAVQSTPPTPPLPQKPLTVRPTPKIPSLPPKPPVDPLPPIPPPPPPLELPDSISLPHPLSINVAPRPATPPFPVDDLPPPPASLLHSKSQENLFDSTYVLPPPPPPETDADDFPFQNTTPVVVSPTNKQPPFVSPKPNKSPNHQLHNGPIPNSKNILPVPSKPQKSKPVVPPPQTSQSKKQGPPSPPKPSPSKPSLPQSPSTKTPPPVTSPKPSKVGSLRITNASFLDQLNNSLQGTNNENKIIPLNPTTNLPPTSNKPTVVTRQHKPLPPRRSDSTRLSTVGTPKIPPSPPQRLK
ncbi:uncharacterized protein [Antedon mediterranea]|uniref:uncharacterized protein n=1 Tax=Antedon mediterranea TaxID=105859 RepID=UPI003AF578DE